MKKHFSAFYLEDGCVVTVPHVDVSVAKSIKGCGHPVDDAKHVTKDGTKSNVRVSLFYNGKDWHVLLHGCGTEHDVSDSKFFKASLQVDVLW
jgi:hypothetical protein